VSLREDEMGENHTCGQSRDAGDISSHSHMNTLSEEENFISQGALLGKQ